MKTHFTLQKNLILVVIVAFFTTIAGCINGLNFEKGNGKITKQQRTISSFSSIEISGAYEVYLTQDTAPSLSVEADENLLSLIITKVENNTLIIENKENIRGSKPIKVFVNTSEIKNIDISGSVDLKSTDNFKTNELNIDISGLGNIDLKVELQKLSIDCSGSGNINLSGTADNINAELSGAANIYAYNLTAKTFTLSSSGAGKANLNVTDKLDIETSGASTVNYKGNPNINQRTSGASSIHKVE